MLPGTAVYGLLFPPYDLLDPAPILLPVADFINLADPFLDPTNEFG